jgi:hypothetical protein
MSDALERLIAKTRPFKQFTIKYPDGSTEALQVRRTNVADNERIGRSYTEAYDNKIKALQNDETADCSVLRRSLMRQRPEDLAKYIAAATRSEIESDVLDLFDGEEGITAESEKVKTKVEEEQKKMEEALAKEPHDVLLNKALEKREHFMALFEANSARMRVIASLTIYDLDGNPFFPTLEDVSRLDELTLENMISAATKALTEGEGEDSPLK